MRTEMEVNYAPGPPVWYLPAFAQPTIAYISGSFHDAQLYFIKGDYISCRHTLRELLPDIVTYMKSYPGDNLPDRFFNLARRLETEYENMSEEKRIADLTEQRLSEAKSYYANRSIKMIYCLKQAGGLLAYLEDSLESKGARIPDMTKEKRGETTYFRVLMEVYLSRGHVGLKIPGGRQAPEKLYTAADSLRHAYGRLLMTYRQILSDHKNQQPDR